MNKEKYIPCLLETFRQYGYDGASIAKIAEATNLGKASLYYHFPGGKEEMVKKVLDFLAIGLEELLKPLKEEGNAVEKITKMCQGINELYEGGKQPCLLAILLMGSQRDIFQQEVKELLNKLINEIAAVLIAAGLEKTKAREKGEDAAIAIQGALILAQAIGDPTPFKRIIAKLPQQICADLS